MNIDFLFRRLYEIQYGARRTLRNEGRLAFMLRTVRWLAGERRYHNRTTVSLPPPPAPPALPADTVVIPRVQVVKRAQRPSTPLVSIIVPIYNALPYVQACIKSLETSASSVPYELVLIDNGSLAEVARWLDSVARHHEYVTLIRSTTNLGYGGAINIAARSARSEYLLLCNSDVEFTDHALDLMVEALKANPDIGVLSPKTNYVGEGQQLSPDAVDLEAADASTYAAGQRNRDDLTYPVERVAFFCVLLRQSLFQFLNGFDEAFELGNFEDENFCSRVLMLGLRLAVLESAFVYHHGSKTFETNGVDHAGLMQHNRLHYLDRLANFSTDRALLYVKTKHGLPRPKPNPKISIIVRTRNRPHKLVHALTSLAHQQFADFEVIVVNDGGVDVQPVLNTFEHQLDLHYITYDDPKSPSEASNLALGQIRGEYFTHLDDDDIIYPYHLAGLYQLACSEPASRVYYANYNRALMKENDGVLTRIERVASPFWHFNAEALLVSNAIVVHGLLLHRSVHDTVGDYDPSLFVLQDWDYLIRASRHYRFTALPRISAEYHFYLSMSNILVARRAKTYLELQQIYATYPTRQRSSMLERQATLKAYKQQIERIEQVSAAVTRRQKSERQAAFEILHHLIGFQMPPFVSNQ